MSKTQFEVVMDNLIHTRLIEGKKDEAQHVCVNEWNKKEI